MVFQLFDTLQVLHLLLAVKVHVAGIQLLDRRQMDVYVSAQTGKVYLMCAALASISNKTVSFTRDIVADK